MGAIREEASMKPGIVFGLFCVTLFVLGIGTTLNADLVSTRYEIATGFGTVTAPVILILVLFTAGSWFLFFLVTSFSQGFLLRKVEHVSTAFAAKDRELQTMKAALFEESAETLRRIAVRLNPRLYEPGPLLAGRKAEPAPHAVSLESRAA